MSFGLVYMRERHATGGRERVRVHGYNNWTIVSLKVISFLLEKFFLAAANDSCAMQLAVSSQILPCGPLLLISCPNALPDDVQDSVP